MFGWVFFFMNNLDTIYFLVICILEVKVVHFVTFYGDVFASVPYIAKRGTNSSAVCYAQVPTEYPEMKLLSLKMFF